MKFIDRFLRRAAPGLAALLLALPAAASDAARTVLVFGDSLSAAYGIGAKEGWPTLLAERLEAEKFNYTVANLSISGETAAGGASRIARALAQTKPAVVIVALGSNDGLRGLPVAQMKAHLETIVTAAEKQGAKVVLVGNRMPPNYGGKYAAEFFETFAQVARAHKAPFVPFILEPVALKRDYFQPDNLHPTAAAQPLILEPIWKALAPLLKR